MGYATSPSMKVIIFLMFVLVATTSSQSQNTRCPFDLLYHLGDGVFDNGNAVANMQHGSRLPAANIPYGNTHPGKPTGRWSDGLLDIDYGAQGLGFSEITAYLSENSSSANAIMFAEKPRIKIPSYTVSLNIQMSWFKKYLNAICPTPTDRADKLSNALFLFGDVEANDITYSLIQRKSIQQVQSYIPYVTKAQINAAREVIKMGATRIILPGNAPMGLGADPGSCANTADYDDMGCLKSVNDLIKLKNNELQQAIFGLQKEFPNTFIMYADFYNSELALIQETSISGKNKKMALQACCGVGGKYNYDKKRFCGYPGVPVCSDPNQYFFWDGIHLTQEANNRLSSALQQATLATLNCTIS
ncbi:hypothetical protein ACJIZ3_024152 [Penstemon smallii]|uniref:Uncharacterized protein n=1 Tax=Penstemon smallii TaxID=265156 RepID=A0ABD3TSE3_9LAMI